MTALQIKAHYDQLEEISKTFAKQADTTVQVLAHIKQSVNQLQSGDWQGVGANLFYLEMEQAIVPSFQRLINALYQASQTSAHIQAKMREAEHDAAQLLLMGGLGNLVNGPVAQFTKSQQDSLNNGANREQGNAITENKSPAWQAKNPLLARDPQQLFTSAYMDGLIDSKVTGADTDALHDAMTKLAGNPQGAELDQVLNDIAHIRQRPVAQIKAEYQKFLAARDQAIETKGSSDQLNIIHPDFMGSISQMRYGKVVGDAFGMDPVFGAMLNPTGGLVGPDNWAVDTGHKGGYVAGGAAVVGGAAIGGAALPVSGALALILTSEAVSYHGAVHDAAGYLYNYHKVGPGYDYLGLEKRATSDPLTGQREGLRYWSEKTPGVLNQVGGKTAEYLMRGVVGAVDTKDSVINYVGNGLKKIGDLF